MPEIAVPGTPLGGFAIAVAGADVDLLVPLARRLQRDGADFGIADVMLDAVLDERVGDNLVQQPQSGAPSGLRCRALRLGVADRQHHARRDILAVLVRPTISTSSALAMLSPSGPSFIHSTVAMMLCTASRLTAICASAAPVSEVCPRGRVPSIPQ